MIPGCVKTPWNVWTTMVSQAASLPLGQQLTSFVQVSTTVQRTSRIGISHSFFVFLWVCRIIYEQEYSIHRIMQSCIHTAVMYVSVQTLPCLLTLAAKWPYVAPS